MFAEVNFDNLAFLRVELHLLQLSYSSRASRSSCGLRNFFVFSGAEVKMRPLSKWKLGDFFPNFVKKIPILKKKFKEFFFSQHAHTSYMATIYYHFILFLLQFNGNIVSVIANLFGFFYRKFCALYQISLLRGLPC